ncbi:hypothetical protein BBO99_00007531 [Phytophthora kernoviae]|uniref:ABC transporter domain-containing protein n=2 Tax=Phytophthora kernoviae TaxID=325452 RepID=A0A3R7J4P2_9STRA|nr:hypothetical protein G195_008425 [Phytophthora kernoviae 00238/432]KAG2520520.1 hypothetical protein JM18_007066 [Phytophthora kernoviae]RLN21093.1 hypothetical protein BBI17_007851 [Phytophthora kernoviae]RLN76482.1 hypothetical protein BBO99_00007531 [Phytophthora kernoviae]
MGPSGSGKTTLLDILADRISSGTVKGGICVNGKTRDVKTFRAVASYVAQEDSLLGSFTALETLEMAARLSLPNSVTHTDIRNHVQTVINEMGLRACEHARVGDIFRKGISGGQKRRLSIAIELLSDPAILLLDEPTSGLDSASTFKVMQFVSRLCKEGRTVICTIHQPSSLVYDLFTNVAILAAGETVYFGPRINMLPHFATLGYMCPNYQDPLEHFISVANTDFTGHGDTPQLVAGVIERLPPSPMRQLVVLLRRNTLDNMRNPGIYWVRLVMYTALSFMMGTMFLSTNTKIVDHDVVYLITYANSFLVFMSIAVLPFFIEQRAVFLRERTNSGLNVFSYVIANFLGALPGIFLIAVTSTLLVNYLAGLNSYGIFLLTVFLSLVVAESLMHLIAACVPHFIIGMALGAAIFGWFILSMGLFVPRPAIPNYWIWAYYLGFMSYGFEVLMYNQFHNESSTEGQAILSRFGFEDVDLGRDLAILAANAVAFEMMFALILYKFHTGRR